MFPYLTSILSYLGEIALFTAAAGAMIFAAMGLR